MIPCGVIIYCYERIALALRERVRTKCEARRLSHLPRPLQQLASTAANVENNDDGDLLAATDATSVGGNNDRIVQLRKDSLSEHLPANRRATTGTSPRPKLSWSESGAKDTMSGARNLKSSSHSLAARHLGSISTIGRVSSFQLPFRNRDSERSSYGSELSPLVATSRSSTSSGPNINRLGGLAARRQNSRVSSSSAVSEGSARLQTRAGNTMEGLLHEKDLADIRHKRRTNRYDSCTSTVLFR